MAVREKRKELIIAELTGIIAGKLLAMKPGTTLSISGLVREIYLSRGYEYIYLGEDEGHAWTKDGGKTFSITDWEQEEVLVRVAQKIKGKRRMDFSAYRRRLAGTPHNLLFVLRRSFL